MYDAVIVIPCYNEAKRLPVSDLCTFTDQNPQVRFVLVNDGSTDDTSDVLHGLVQRDPHAFCVIDLPANRGKAEAVRVGMLKALGEETLAAGYWDADLATPVSAIPEFIEALRSHDEVLFIIGSRVRLLGRSISRKPSRHLLGRIFATVASATLSLPVYDTQCGSKLFRNTDDVRALFEEPFVANWVFDVELIARLGRALGWNIPALAGSILELPLTEWHHVEGSKVRALDFPRSAVELGHIFFRYRVPSLFSRGRG